MSTLCRQVHEFADGQLDPLSARAFRHHLADCAACQRELYELLQLMAVEDELDPDQAADQEPELPMAGPRRWPDGSGQTSGQTSGRNAESSDGGAGTVRVIPLHRHGKLGRMARAVVPMAAAAAALLVCARWQWRVEQPAGTPAITESRARRPAIAATPAGVPASAASDRLALALSRTRSIEGRLSYPGADRYRPYDVMRAQGATAVEDIAISLMADMEQHGDFHGLAAAELLHGNLRKAEDHLGKAASSADIASDRALVTLLRGDAQAALLMLEPVLAAHPRHAQALWNRGLALEALGLWLEAARAFEAVAALGEPGWSEEARDRAARLRGQIESRTQGWRRARDAAERLAMAGEPMPEDVVHGHPGEARMALYRAARAAATADAIEALRPLAGALDRQYRTRALGRYVDRVAAEDVAVRAPLARAYGRLLAGEDMSGERARRLMAEAGDAGQWDIALGVFSHVAGELSPGEGDALVARARRLSAQSGDSWPALLAIADQVRGLMASRRPGEAELRARQGLDLCGSGAGDPGDDAAEATGGAATEAGAGAGNDLACARLYDALARAYIDQHRLSDARRSLLDGCERARRAGDHAIELKCLVRFAHIASMRDDVAGSRVALARAYLDEYRQRIEPCAGCPPDCDNWFYVHESLAGLHINQNDLSGARAHMDRADALIGHGCERPVMTVQRAFALAHVLRVGGADERAFALRQDLGAMRAAAERPEQRAILDHIEGRLLIEREPEVARARLFRAIEVASELPGHSTLAAKARAYSYSVLIQDAAARGLYQRALELIGQEAGTPVAGRCVLGVAAEEAVVVVARDPDGALVAERRALEPRQRIAAAELVPARVRAALAGCEVVDVHARSPYQGSAGLLPAHIAWRYRLGPGLATAETATAAAARGARRTVVISDIVPPPELELPALAPHRAGHGVDVHLRGPDATPARVLASMAEATAIAIHAHGVMDPEVSDAAHLVLSRGADGGHALTAEMVRGQRLSGAPTVILGACHGAYTPEYAHGSTSLASAFIHSGARLVIASPAPISDAGASELFAAIEQRMARGQPAALALRDQRSRYSDPRERAWAEQIVIFE